MPENDPIIPPASPEEPLPAPTDPVLDSIQKAIDESGEPAVVAVEPPPYILLHRLGNQGWTEVVRSDTGEVVDRFPPKES
jgi:hypothetical protein